jgi:hypothetical protein
MDNYHIVAIFTYPSDLAVVKTLLESNNINCYVRDELTVQVHNFFSNAIGGIRLEVPAEQLDLAQKVIEDNGFESFLANKNHKEIQSENEVYNPFLIKFLKSGISFVIISVIILFIVIFGLTVFYG